MIRLNKFESFIPYRINQTVRMPEGKNPKKNALVSILAPSIKDEFQYLTTQKVLEFRYLQKYLIDKTISYKLHGSGVTRFIPNENGDITEFVNALQSRYKNLELVSFKRGVKPTALREENVLFEINYLIEKIMNNPHDTRTILMKSDDVFKALYQQLQNAPKEFGINASYPIKTIVIPVSLWVSEAEMKQYATVIPKSTKNYLGRLFYLIGEDPKKYLEEMFHGYQILLTHGNCHMILSDTLTDDMTGKDVLKLIQKFFRRSMSEKLMYDDTKDQNAEAEKKVVIQSAKADEVDRVIEKAKINPENLSDSDRQKLEDSVKVEETEDSNEIKVTKIEGISANTDVDIIMKAQMEGKSIENAKRDIALKSKYKDLSFAGKSLESIMDKTEQIEVPTLDINIHTVNPEMKHIKSFEFEKAYNDKLEQYDFINILMHFSTCKPALYLVKDPVVEDISDEINRLYRYTVEFEDENRKRHHFRFLMPKWYQDKYLFLNRQKWNIIHQKIPFPVSKTEPGLCQVSTNYNKIRMHRYGANISSRLTKLRKILTGDECPKQIKIISGNVGGINKSIMTTMEFDDLGSYMYQVRFGEYVVYFDYDDAKAVIPNPNKTIPENDVFQFAIANKSKHYYYLSSNTNKVYDETGKDYGELGDFMIQKISEVVPGFEKQFDGVSAGTKFAYTRAHIMTEQVPLILVIAAADPGGLEAVLEKGKINHYFTDKRPTDIDKDNQGIVQFNDGFLVFDRYPYENSLLLNGLSAFPSREFNYYDMASRDTYIDIFDVMFNRRTLIDGIENFYYLEVDPITHDILEQVGYPTQFTELMLFANAKLSDNSYNIDSAYYDSRLRSNEIVNVYLYQELAKAYASWKIGRIPKFSIPEDAVIKDLLTATIVDSHSKLNITLELENDRQVKLKGPGGINEERSFTLEKRAFHPSMRGIIGMNSTPSGEVGINRHMTLNANIDDARGFMTIEKKDYDGSELATPGELLNTFGPESADIERVAMAISQSKHLVPTEHRTSNLVSYDMDRVVPFVSNDFAFRSKKPGKIVEISDDIMIIQYDDGTYDDIDLSEHPDKNTDGGFFIMNQMKTDYKVGYRFKENEILAYDPKYISEKDMFGDHLGEIGTLARIAIVSNGTVYEDAGYISDKIAHELATRITQHKSIILSQFSNIKYMVKKGQHVNANDPLIVFDDTQDEFTSQMLANMAAEANDDEEIVASSAPIVSKVTGTIKDIQIYYTVPLENMTPSLQKIIKAYNGEISKRKKIIEKYRSTKDSNTILAPSGQVTPDSTGRVKGIKVGDGILIEFYIEYLDIMAPGDKLTNYTALKMVCSDVIPQDKAAYTDFNEEDKIDAYLSSIGIYKRMCLDIVKVGGIGKILVEDKRRQRNQYLDRIKKELKKK